MCGISRGIVPRRNGKHRQIPLEVKAVGVHAYKEYCTGYDVILLGPQIAYRREKIAAECGNLPVLAIAPGDYSAGNAAIFSLRYAICGPRRITSYPVQYSL